MEYNYQKDTVRKILTILILLLLSKTTQAQDSLTTKTKSYNSFEAPLIEDNSFFIEEAFNQEAGVVQFISTCYVTKFTQGDIAYSFTHELPLKGVKHQFSYTLNYFMMPAQLPYGHGLGDLMVNYRYELAGKNDWALIAPRLSLLIPTGDVSKNFGLGAWGGQVNLPMSKMVSKRIVTHYNAGFTFLKSAQFNLSDNVLQPTIIHRDLTYINAGASIIWMPAERVNLMFEYMSTINDAFELTGQVSKQHQQVLNPGLRYAFAAGRSQIVPGIGLPIVLQNGQTDRGMFFYLSIEPNFNLKGN